MAEDRLTLLCQQTLITGIDFVAVVDPEVQTTLRVFFIVEDPLPWVVPVPLAAVSIWAESGGTRIAQITVTDTTWTVVDGRNVLEIAVAEPGDHSLYVLHLESSVIDHFFNDVRFSFKQGCPSVLDCRREPEPDCPLPAPLGAIDPMARDFGSIRRALLDHAAAVDPDWTHKSDADVGVMLIELMAALGDELNYVQDRFVREGRLGELSQRRSARLLARLLDYEVHDGRSPSGVVELRVAGSGNVDAGTRVWAHRMGEAPLVYEIGEGLVDRATAPAGEPRQFWLHEAWNEIAVHEPDGAKPKLPRGATELYLVGEFPKNVEVPLGETAPQWWAESRRKLVLHDAEHTHLVHVESIEVLVDQLTAQTITRITWAASEALPCAMVIADMHGCANVVPITAGETFEEFFAIRGGAELPATIRRDVVERQGPLDAATGRRNPLFRYSPLMCERQRLGWLGSELRSTSPELELQQVAPDGLDAWDPDLRWTWRRTLLDSASDDTHFTIEDGTWRRIIGFHRPQGELVHRDWAANAGYTLRFGDSEFGSIPADGTVFRVRYRSGPGRSANVPAGTIRHLVHPIEGGPASEFLLSVDNPFDLDDGLEPESVDRVKLLAPEAYRHDAPRAVQPEDYVRLAQTLPWVERADAVFRWTGSWPTVFVTVDPRDAYEFTPDQHLELDTLMDAVRQVNRDVVVLEPDYIDLDLEIGICTQPGSYPARVESDVITALIGPRGFFATDQFSFATPLRRSALEAKIQSVPGVRAVESIQIRARELTEWRHFTEAIFAVGPGQILRVLNDANRPEFGTVRVRAMVAV
jgi:hypothetical protein